MMHDSKRDVANLLHEEAETRSIRERLRQKQQQQAQQKQNKRNAETIGSAKNSAGVHFERCTPAFFVLFVKLVEFFTFYAIIIMDFISIGKAIALITN